MPTGEYEARKDYLLFLSYHLLNHQPFRERLEEMNRDFPHMRRYPWNWLNSRSAEKLRKHDYLEYETIGDYRARLQELASQYNLRAEWALEVLHRGVGDPTPAGMVSPDSGQGRTKKYTIIWNDTGSRSKKEVRQDIMRQFEQQWHEHEQRTRSAGLDRLRSSRSAIKRRTGLVFRAICLGESWDNVAEREKQAPESIRREVVKLAGLLGLRVPDLE